MSATHNTKITPSLYYIKVTATADTVRISRGCVGSGMFIVAVYQADIAQLLHLVVTEIIGAFVVLAGGKKPNAALAVAVQQLQGAGGIDNGKIP